MSLSASGTQKRAGSSSPTRRVGILGGGQLARMLVQEGQKMGLEMHVLSSSADDPAAQVTNNWHKGDINSASDVRALMKAVDVVTFESEFVNTSELKDAKTIQPSPTLIGEFSDRLSQKTWLERHGLPTSRFTSLQNKNDVYSFVNERTKIKDPVIVAKKRRFGYDGYGTYILRNKNKVASWMRKHALELKDFILEDFQNFRRELAFQIAINARGEFVVFPLIEWQAENSKCLWVKGPVKHPSFAALSKKVAKALKESAYVGLFAVELFETRDGLVINEIAPRVHNSAHYSLEATPTNQFQAHLRAILDLPLPKKIRLNARGFAMLNLLGTRAAPIEATDVALHWYGKIEARTGRKMGHLTALGNSPEEALRLVLKAGKKRA